MNHRHLLPNEIDLLVDGEAGFGVAPLRAHILECSDCRERLEDARVVVDALESLPYQHFAVIAYRWTDTMPLKARIVKPITSLESRGEWPISWLSRKSI